jgi:hypothetical protein
MIERRQPGSPRHEIDRGHTQWLEMMVIHRGKVVALVGFLASVVTFLATTAAMRIVAMERLDRVEASDAVQDTAIAALRKRSTTTERDVAANRFLLCVMAARIDPKRSEATCESILSQGVP